MAEIEQVDDIRDKKELRPPSAKKPTLEEIESKSDKDWTLEDMFVLFKSDYCPDGVDEVDEEIWPKYFQQLEDSEGTNYKFVKVEKSNSLSWGVGRRYYITFYAALDIDTDTSSEAVDSNTTTFQALVWNGPPWVSPSLIVEFCRIRSVAA